MLSSIWEDLKREFRSGNMVTRLIIINFIGFVFINIVRLVALGFGGDVANEAIRAFSMSSDWYYLLTHPWVLITHMFIHLSFLGHLLFNMLFLYWFGRILGDFLGDHRILPVYLLGGFAGALAYFIFGNLFFGPGLGVLPAYGASAAVMGIVVASGVLAPDYIIRLLFIGDVKLKFVVMVLVLIDLFAIPDHNAGGHIAHLGGAVFGAFFIIQLRNGNDLSEPVNKLLANIVNFFKPTPVGAKTRKQTVVYKNIRVNKRKDDSVSGEDPASYQERLDAILDKIKETGYKSLTAEEKEFLQRASKKQ